MNHPSSPVRSGSGCVHSRRATIAREGWIREHHVVGWTGLGGALASGVRSIARSIVPVACPGCGLNDVPWCWDCAAPWWEDPFRSESQAGRLDIDGRPPFPVWSVVPLEGPAHRMITAWKDGKRRDLDPFFADAMRRAANAVGSSLDCVEVIVPVPPHRRSVRTRGTDLTAALAVAVAEGLTFAGVARGVDNLLVNSGWESRILDDRARWTNAIRGIQANQEVKDDGPVLLVDDVVTTGASLARACDVLEAHGIAVVGALTLAATPRPSRPRL